MIQSDSVHLFYLDSNHLNYGCTRIGSGRYFVGIGNYRVDLGAVMYRSDHRIYRIGIKPSKSEPTDIINIFFIYWKKRRCRCLSRLHISFAKMSALVARCPKRIASELASVRLVSDTEKRQRLYYESLNESENLSELCGLKQR